MRLDRFMVPLTLTAALLNSTQLPVLGQIQKNDDDVIPAEIVLRLLNSDLLEVQQILLYELPNDLPIQLPLPDQATVLVSMVYRVKGLDVDLYRVLLDVSQPPETVAAQYRQQLESQGWEEPMLTAGDLGGFIPSAAQLNNQLIFCSADKSQSILVLASSQADNTTSLDLNLAPVPDNNSSCRSDLASAQPPDFESPMPLLSPPVGAIVTPQGSSASGNKPNEYSFVEVEATIESELSAEAIAQHYAAQWESAGWRPYGEETNGRVKKVWILEDEAGQPWQGTLTIEPSAEQSGMYRAIATVEVLQENSHE
ncbi:hypothetical protein IQ273_06410 [Nodosilinea sp. LEGE 07298]|uniref:hypothetical protein n=1 Tax=Nodosilinea sp. LEGE 07298 TaxID=2777970 RepID=UPI00187DDB7C|nr:hypothetical protein [Nodosilinea sp. LEGE 07298]MBE9109050.1 hypothetical protein [Nodosilinea sp. LEGE 07298]